MGIGDRDYMRRPPEDGGRNDSLDSRTENFLSGFLRRYPNFFRNFAIGIGVLIVIGIVVAEIRSR
jgi:hypothetical protein